MDPQHEALKQFPSQIKYSIDHYKPHGLRAEDFTNIVIGGLGGSGIGGQLTRALFRQEMPIPVEVVSDYSLPLYVDQNTLVILSSYSGNTEETLEMFEEALDRGCKPLIVTSGGLLKELAEQHQLQTYEVAQGFQPRMALGYSFTFLIQVFAELIGHDVTEALLNTVDHLQDSATYESEAGRMMNVVKAAVNSKFVVVTDNSFEAVGLRFCQQMQENAKHEAFLHVLPEANHNVIESYYGSLDSQFIFLYSEDNERVASRFEFLTSLLEVEYNKVVNIAISQFHIRTVYEIIYRLDWLSLYIADEKRVDSLTVPNVQELKAFLSGQVADDSDED